jgi:acyl carrier protein
MTYTKDDIYKKVSEILAEQFEVDPEAITPEARLREDLDIDSIDAVNLIIELKSFTVKKLAVDSFRHVKTLGDVVDAVYLVVVEQQPPA